MVATVTVRVHATADQPDRRSPESRAQRFLADIGDVLAASLDDGTTVTALAEACVPAIADWCAVVISDDRMHNPSLASVHVDPGIDLLLRQFAWNVTSLTGHNVTRPMLFTTDIDDTLRSMLLSDQHQQKCDDLGTTSLIVAPLRIRREPIGAILLATCNQTTPFTEADVALSDDLARRTAVAIDNARHYQEARAAEARMRHQAARLEALAEASKAFAMARLDLDAVLKAVTGRVAELLGDVCSIRLLSDDGASLIPVAFHHTIPEAYAVFQTLPSFGVRGVHEGTVGHVMKTGEPLLIPHRTVEQWKQLVLPDWIPYVEQFGMHSLLIVPLNAGGTTIGTIGLWRERTPEPFNLDDQQFLQDLADRAGLAVDNARLYSHAQAAIAARDEFLSVAAHELKTPVTSLRGYAQLLLRQLRRGEDIPTERLQNALASIDRQTWRLSVLISQLLDTSRIHSGELSVDPGRTDIKDLVGELIEQAATLSDTHEIVVDIAGPLIANVDALRIEQVLTNLIENAIKYSPSGGVVRVEAGIDDSGDLRIAVEDTGPGIPEDERERVFDRFYQINSQASGGMGLGLFISRQIVAMHGGTIGVEAPDAGGTRFVLRLPNDV